MCHAFTQHSIQFRILFRCIHLLSYLLLLRVMFHLLLLLSCFSFSASCLVLSDVSYHCQNYDLVLFCYQCFIQSFFFLFCILFSSCLTSCFCLASLSCACIIGFLQKKLRTRSTKQDYRICSKNLAQKISISNLSRRKIRC